jgi:hypothetical protein
MSVAYTAIPSVQVPGFEDMRLLTRYDCLLCASCSSDQRFAFAFLQIPPHDGHPWRSANGSPCRVRRGLPAHRRAPPSGCALPGARIKKPALASGLLVRCRDDLPVPLPGMRTEYYDYDGAGRAGDHDEMVSGNDHEVKRERVRGGASHPATGSSSGRITGITAAVKSPFRHSPTVALAP